MLPRFLDRSSGNGSARALRTKTLPHPTKARGDPITCVRRMTRESFTAYRVLKPEWWIVKQVYSPVQIGPRTISPAGGTFVVSITNRYSFTDLNELVCHWIAYRGDSTRKKGVLHINCAPSESVQASFPAPDGVTRLRLDFTHPDGTSIVAVNLEVAGAPVPQPPAALAAGDALTSQDSADSLRISNNLMEIVFDKHTGSIQSWSVHNKNIVIGGPILNLGEAKASGERNYFRAKSPPVIDNAQVTATPNSADGTVRVSVTGTVLTTGGAWIGGLTNPGGSTIGTFKPNRGTSLGTLTVTYDIKPDAEVGVKWNLDWSTTNKSLWEEGLKISLPATMTQMKWHRDSYFTDYPDGHIGEPSGTCRASEILFRASKRNLHWLTLTDVAGLGVVLLPTEGSPLVARAASSPSGGTTLFASREVAGPRDFSGNWVSAHDIRARKDRPLSGAFIMRAMAP